MKNSVFLLLGSLVLTGCASVQPVQRPAFPAAEYQALNKTGTGIIKGQAFLKTRGGDVKTAAGNTIILNPVTSYSDHWYTYSYLLNKPLAEPDKQIDKYERSTTADAQGNFTFNNVPAGQYYVATKIVWEIPSQGLSPNYTGGVVAAKTAVQDGQTVDVVLTR